MEKLNDTLIGRRVRIKLLHEDSDMGKDFSVMPTVNGTFIRRFFFIGWGYIVKLDEALLLDREGMQFAARRKISTSYLAVYPFATQTYSNKDALYLELTGKANKLIKTKDAELHVILRYIKSPEEVPNEIDKNDQFLKDNPGICSGGYIKLIDE